MKSYVGISRIAATEMTRGDYCARNRVAIKRSENSLDAGYMIENEHSTSVSWIPKKEFEAVYTEFDPGQGGGRPHVIRLLAELKIVKSQVSKLEAFILTPVFFETSTAKQELLRKQRNVMYSQISVLEQRLQLEGVSHVQTAV